MPKIKASTIQIHRAGQKSLLLRQARKLVLAGGVAALSFDILAKKAKLSRPAVYEYFKSKNDLIASLIEAEFPPWEADLLNSLNRAQAPIEAIENFVRDQLHWINEDKHKLAFVLMSSHLDEDAMALVHRLHQKLTEILRIKLIQLGIKLPEECMAMILGVLNSSAHSIQKSKTTNDSIESTVVFIVGGIRAVSSL